VSHTRLRIGILANELFDPRLGRMGGFGWAASRVARCFEARPELGVEPVFLLCERAPAASARASSSHRTRIVQPRRTRLGHALAARRERFDILLAIDYRPSYRPILFALPRTPVIVWVRDPRSPDDEARIETLRLPGADDVRPAGIEPIDTTSLARVARASSLLRRPLLFASPAPALLCKKAGAAYAAQISELALLPNPIDIGGGRVAKSRSPRVVFLARLDPYKRPWLFVELARRFVDVEFLMLGEAYTTGEGTWKPRDLPGNLRLLGHVDGEEKERLLSSAWVMVNTSLHEALPVSFLEALACETPLLACQDPEGVVSRFGIDAGRWDGSGVDGVPRLCEGLRRLLDDDEARTRLGRSGRAWVEATHSPRHFVAALSRLCERAGTGPLLESRAAAVDATP
jgi:glycosyltransferase involved in cell wall biosynthesis